MAKAICWDLVLCLQLGLSLAVPNAYAVPNIKLSNGVLMPQMSLGTWQYDNATAGEAIKLGISAGFTHIDTAENYLNQVGVGAALAAYPRESFFLTTKTLPCTSVGRAPGSCYSQTISDVDADLKALNVSYVDLILLHGASHRGPGVCDAAACAADAEQWAAYTAIYKAGKARAIGVSNYCQSCFECLLKQPGTLVPTVNQIQLHVGMGDDPQNLVSYCESKGIVVQAYSPLGDGKLIKDTSLATIGANYNKSAAQVALKWLVQKGVAVVTKSDSPKFLAQDIDMYSWAMTESDVATLGKNTAYPGDPSWACTA